VLEIERRLAPAIVGTLAVAIVEAGDVGGHAGTERCAEQGVDGPVRRLAHEIPERDVDGADGRDELDGAAAPGSGSDARGGDEDCRRTIRFNWHGEVIRAIVRHPSVKSVLLHASLR